MGASRAIRSRAATALMVLAIAAPQAAPARELPSSAVMIDGDDRLSPAAFAEKNGLSRQQLASRFGATGLVRCGGAVGTGQLVGAGNVIVTAAHMLFAPDGLSRDRKALCTFEIETSGGRQVVPIRLADTLCGSREPYADPAMRDWAVVPLERTVPGVRPYPLGSALKVPGRLVLVAAARTGGVEAHSLQHCRARVQTARAPDGLREVAIDCDAEGGTSGAALLDEEGSFQGVYVGFRSAHPGQPGPFSMSHYNFGVTAEGGLRRAIMDVVSRHQPLSAAAD
ncbi:S1 family peptidase [Ancylobacter radicis]|nr:serine protease [Ancylobacter radicis]